MVIATLLTLSTLFAFVSCNNDDDWDNNFTKNFDMTVDGCERVGSVLIVDLTLKNKSGKDVTKLDIYADNGTYKDLGKSHDDLNNDLSDNIEFSLNGATFQRGLYNQTIKANETFKLKLRVDNFDTTNKASKVWLYIKTKSVPQGMLDQSGIVLENLAITDNRVLSNGVQVGDRKLPCAFIKAQRDITTNDVYFYFKVKNNTGQKLGSLILQDKEGVKDNLGNSYSLQFGEDINNMTYNYATPLDVNAELTFIVKAQNVTAQASSFSGEFVLTADNYTVEDDVLRFFDLDLMANK